MEAPDRLTKAGAQTVPRKVLPCTGRSVFSFPSCSSSRNQGEVLTAEETEKEKSRWGYRIARQRQRPNGNKEEKEDGKRPEAGLPSN
jgi:hypothetical protein